MFQMDTGQLNQRCSLSGARALIRIIIALGNRFPKTVCYGLATANLIHCKYITGPGAQIQMILLALA